MSPWDSISNIDSDRYQTPVVLTIAGSDSIAGAGIQADLKTIQAHGCYGITVITAVTAQNTHEIRSIELISPAIVKVKSKR